MAKLPRVLQKIFGLNGGTTEFGKIGSEAAGSPVTTKDLALIQSLAQYLNGLYAITNDANEPPRIQDINALYYLITSQLKYIFQSGIPEWDPEENYYSNVSIVQVGGLIYRSVTGTDVSPNVGNNPSTDDGTNWFNISNQTFTYRGSMAGLNVDDLYVLPGLWSYASGTVPTGIPASAGSGYSFFMNFGFGSTWSHEFYMLGATSKMWHRVRNSSGTHGSWALIFDAASVGSNWNTALTTALGTNWPAAFETALGSGTVLTTGNIESAGIYGEYTILLGTEWIIPAGIYMMAANGQCRLSIYTGSEWALTTSTFLAGVIFSDGVNYKLVSTSSSDVYIHYRKLF